MRDKIRNAILVRILDGTYPPGTRLKEMDLARAFNVSQAPVREALRELETLRLVESQRYRGTRVCSIDLEQLREAYELRAEIEEASAKRAMPCAEDDLLQLDAYIRGMREAMAGNDYESYMQNGLNFHRHIVVMSKNRLFLHAWDHLAWDVRARIAARNILPVALYVDERETIVAALRAGDGERAGFLVRRLIERYMAHLAQFETDVSNKAESAA
jgi:DNA-binding GntR family transcriptional regulator